MKQHFQQLFNQHSNNLTDQQKQTIIESFINLSDQYFIYPHFSSYNNLSNEINHNNLVLCIEVIDSISNKQISFHFTSKTIQIITPQNETKSCQPNEIQQLTKHHLQDVHEKIEQLINQLQSKENDNVNSIQSFINECNSVSYPWWYQIDLLLNWIYEKASEQKQHIQMKENKKQKKFHLESQMKYLLDLYSQTDGNNLHPINFKDHMNKLQSIIKENKRIKREQQLKEKEQQLENDTISIEEFEEFCRKKNIDVSTSQIYCQKTFNFENEYRQKKKLYKQGKISLAEILQWLEDIGKNSDDYEEEISSLPQKVKDDKKLIDTLRKTWTGFVDQLDNNEQIKNIDLKNQKHLIEKNDAINFIKMELDIHNESSLIAFEFYKQQLISFDQLKTNWTLNNCLNSLFIEKLLDCELSKKLHASTFDIWFANEYISKELYSQLIKKMK